MISRTKAIPTQIENWPALRRATRLGQAAVLFGAVLLGASCVDGSRVSGPLSPVRLPVGHKARYDSSATFERKQAWRNLGTASASASRISPRASGALASMAGAADPILTAISIPFRPEPGPFAMLMPECDDCNFGELDPNGLPTGNGLSLGFNFTFYGNSYNEFWYSTNGFIGFRFQDNGCCSGEAIPAPVEPGGAAINDIIAFAWTDLNPLLGQVTYETRGTAPNRRFILDLKDVEVVGEGKTISTQVILYEGTNVVEIHTLKLPQTEHTITQGVENSTGTAAAFAEGRVRANFALDSDAIRFALVGTDGNKVPSVDPGGNAGGPPVDRYIGVEGKPVTFKATGADADNDQLSFAWDFDGDGLADAETAEASHTYADDGKYVARVMVSDSHGQSATASIDVYVENAAPSAELNGPEVVDEGSPIVLSVGNVVDASKADQDAGFTFAFDCGNGFGDFGPATSASCPTVDNGTRTVSLKVRDKNGGESVPAAKSVSIRNVAPSVEAGASLTAMSGQMITLSGRFSDVGMNDKMWKWSWGTPEQGVAITKQYSAAGEAAEQGAISGQYRACGAGPQEIRLAVIDKDNGRGEASVTVHVQPLSVEMKVKPSAIALRVNDRDSDSDDNDDDRYSHEHGRLVTVHVYSTATFDATSIDPGSVRLTNGAGKGTPVASNRKRKGQEWEMKVGHLNRDRLRDVKLRFNRNALIANGDLTGSTVSFNLVARAGTCAYVGATAPVVVKP
jgi:PKD repeat protein